MADRKVAVFDRGRFVDCGRLGDSTGINALAVYNGKLYVGAIPRAEVFRYVGGQEVEAHPPVLRAGRLGADTGRRQPWSPRWQEADGRMDPGHQSHFLPRPAVRGHRKLHQLARGRTRRY
ncbi:MAG: hypothetical protein HYR60_18670, partial [Acidobacteria bacterium]|nr:hypothetical protein [Acidobacteriota bacterium]